MVNCEEITISAVRYMGAYRIEIFFTDGHRNVFDYGELVKMSVFARYRNKNIFRCFRISHDGLTISWFGTNDMKLKLHVLYFQNKVTAGSTKALEAANHIASTETSLRQLECK